MYLSENTQEIMEHITRYDYLPPKWVTCCAVHSIYFKIFIAALRGFKEGNREIRLEV